MAVVIVGKKYTILMNSLLTIMLITSVTIQKNATIDEVHDRDREFYWYIQSTNILTIKVEQQMRLGTVDLRTAME